MKATKINRVRQTAERAERTGQYGGYDIANLQRAFDMIADPNDWRAPIRGECSFRDFAIIAVAVMFYTGTVLEVIRSRNDDELIKVLTVEAVGYRNGPAGP